MKFVHRLGYYLGGFAIGLLILLFFLNGKDASCDYGPNARTVKNIASKPLVYSADAAQTIVNAQLDSATVRNLIRYGSVDFSQSDTKRDSCKVYLIENSFKDMPFELRVKNCDSLATLISVQSLKNH